MAYSIEMITDDADDIPSHDPSVAASGGAAPPIASPASCLWFLQTAPPGNGATGQSAAHGLDGVNGNKGPTAEPCVIDAGSIEGEIVIRTVGGSGARGGDGQSGGAGGLGGAGGPSSCGQGGNGGRGGRGGDGGDGGNGGDGGDSGHVTITYTSWTDGGVVVTDAETDIGVAGQTEVHGGLSGAGGSPGAAGMGGAGGAGFASGGFGSNGTNGQPGEPGVPGAKGLVTVTPA